MFFVVSKVAWVLLQPLGVILMLLVLGLVLVLAGRRRLGLASGALGVIFLGLSAYTNLGALLIGPLEARFPRLAAPPEAAAAIVVLGGGTDGRVSTARGTVETGDAGERLAEALWLAKRYPDARLVLSGGNSLMIVETEAEAETTRRFLVAHGVDPRRLVLEGQSRNTAENAGETLAMLGPLEGRVILVTSAFHMPRSVGIFRELGVDVIAWPVDYRAMGGEGFGFDIFDPPQNIATVTIALREWIGLVAYAQSGRSSEIFPGPAVAGRVSAVAES